MAIYFNITPRFEIDEIRIPLPADDAAWDASSASTCADALGLNGQATAESCNRSGSRRPKQPEMRSALRTMLNNVWDLEPGAINLYSKFVLVHALHVQLWIVQKQLSRQDTGQITPQSMTFPTSGTSTPLSQNDWVRAVESTGSGFPSTNNSGTATPVDGSGQSIQPLRSLNNAFDKWKKAWDDDMMTHYPPSESHHHRFGFCRDAVHFYCLRSF